MHGLAGLSVALSNVMGDASTFLARGDDGHRVEIDRGNGTVVIVESTAADAVRLSRHREGAENFACYIQFAGEEDSETFRWKFQPNPAICGAFSVDGKPAGHEQIDTLRDVLGMPPMLRAA